MVRAILSSAVRPAVRGVFGGARQHGLSITAEFGDLSLAGAGAVAVAAPGTTIASGDAAGEWQIVGGALSKATANPLASASYTLGLSEGTTVDVTALTNTYHALDAGERDEALAAANGGETIIVRGGATTVLPEYSFDWQMAAWAPDYTRESGLEVAPYVNGNATLTNELGFNALKLATNGYSLAELSRYGSTPDTLADARYDEGTAVIQIQFPVWMGGGDIFRLGDELAEEAIKLFARPTAGQLRLQYDTVALSPDIITITASMPVDQTHTIVCKWSEAGHDGKYLSIAVNGGTPVVRTTPFTALTSSQVKQLMFGNDTSAAPPAPWYLRRVTVYRRWRDDVN